MEEPGSGCRSEAEISFDDRSNTSIVLVGGSVTLRVGASRDWEAERQRHLYHDSDNRSQCSQKSDLGYNSASGSGVDNPWSSMRSVGSVGSHGSGDFRGGGGGNNSSAGLPLHVGHAHFGHAVTVSASHLLNGDATHQFPPSMYHASVDAPKSDAATVCSSSVLEDIEVDTESHVSGEGGQTSTKDTMSSAASNKSHPSPPSSVKMAPLRRSNSAEGNRLVDFADRSQVALAAVIPQHRRCEFDGIAAHRASSTAESMSTTTSQTGIMEDNADMASMHNSTGRAGTAMGPMGPPLSRTWLLQQQQNGGSPSRPGSVKSFESNTGSDVVAHVGSDCGGSLTDAQSLLSQEDAMMAAASESGELSAMAKVAIASEDGDSGSKHDEESQPHPLLCSQPDNSNGRTSPGGTIYRGRGIRRYKGRFMHLPLKRFHQNGVHLSSVGEDSSQDVVVGHPVADYDDRWQDRGYSALEDDYQRDSHNYYGSTRRAPSVRSRSRSRSPSPSAATVGRHERKNGYHPSNGAGMAGFRASKAGRGYDIHPVNGRCNGFKDKDDHIASSFSSEKPAALQDPRDEDDDL